ncbi:MAG: F0F1 ATP synthase subunit A [Dongiaceae bacterium]
MAEAHSPLEQFEIKNIVDIPVGHLNLGFSNSSLWMVITTVLATAMIVLSMRGRGLVPTRWQSVAELLYEFVGGMLNDVVGKSGRPFFPFVFSLFMFVLFANLLGMVPLSFTVTSHIIVTFSLAIVIFIGVTIIGFIKNGVGFLRFFAPSGVPILVMPLLIPIEIISYFVRPVSLSVRLFANMMAGHTMLKVFGGFVPKLIGVGVLGAIGATVPLAFMVVFTGFEIGVAIIQAYIFTILTCLYLNDALHPHH